MADQDTSWHDGQGATNEDAGFWAEERMWETIRALSSAGRTPDQIAGLLGAAMGAISPKPNENKS